MSAANNKGWDGDPWEIDSDDDEFVTQTQVGGQNNSSSSRSSLREGAPETTSSSVPGAAASSSHASTSAVGLGGSGSRPGFWGGPKASGTSLLGPNWSSASRSPSNSKPKQAQAPPARPHPISIGSYKEKREAAAAATAWSADGASSSPSSASFRKLRNGSSGAIASDGMGAGSVQAETGRSTSWLIVNPEGLPASPSSSRFKYETDRQSPAAPISPAQTEPTRAEISLDVTSAKSKDFARGLEMENGDKTEASSLRDAICEDADDLLQDPTSALSKISLRWATDDSISTDDAPGSPLTPNAPSSFLSTAALLRTPSQDNNSSSFGPPHVLRATVAGGTPHGLLAGSSSSTPAIATTTSGGDDSATSSRSSTPYQEAGYEPLSAEYGVMLQRKKSSRSTRRQQQFLHCLQASTIDLATLRSLAWRGVPSELRPMVWQLLLGYLPVAKEARKATLARKRAEYEAGVQMAFAKGIDGLDQAIWHQIHIDVPRTNPGRSLWQREATQRSLERILYVWAIRHPACGYVQGINDLATPFFEVFLSAYIDPPPETFDPGLLPAATLSALEADTFWCLGKMLDGIQDNYIFAQPGIQRQVRRLGELVARIDAPLHAHLQSQGVEYMQFSFRWMNCLLMREMAVQSIVRLWDTYLAEGPDAFSDFHLYVCAVFLHKWTTELQTMDFQGIIMYLQSLPTQNWSDKDAEMLLSEAFMYKTLFGNSAHLNK